LAQGARCSTQGRYGGRHVVAAQVTGQLSATFA
jgi:hypothetical protein